jgi:hypothetical protein
MNQARLDIEGKLVPQGADVTRHLVLPDEGKSMEWILAEMEKMDGEMGPHADWKHGKLSGAVYRTSTIIVISYLTLLNRWGRGSVKSYCRCFRALHSFQPFASGRLPCCPQNGS